MDLVGRNDYDFPCFVQWMVLRNEQRHVSFFLMMESAGWRVTGWMYTTCEGICTIFACQTRYHLVYRFIYEIRIKYFLGDR